MRSTPSILTSAVLWLGIWATAAEAQQTNPAYVDDSPLAWEMFQRAEEQIASNLGEAARSLQEVLDEYAMRLIPAPLRGPSDAAAANDFSAARVRVLRVLQDSQNKPLLERYRVMQTPEAQRLLDAGEVHHLVLTRSLTEPGLEAMLRVAQDHLESGRFASAVDQLNEAMNHPDMAHAHRMGARRMAHAHFMLGLALYHLGEPFESSIGRALDELALLDDPGVPTQELIRELQRLGATPRFQRTPQPLSPLDRTPASDLANLVAEEIWSFDLSETLASRTERSGHALPGRPTGRAPTQAREEGSAITTAPTVVGDIVYINQGHTVSALDRFTGSRIWTRDYVDRPTVVLIDRAPGGDEQPMDLNLIAVQGDSLVTITGHAQTAARSNEGRVICLDARTGELRWTTRLDRLRPRTPPPVEDGPAGFPHLDLGTDELEGLFPHGAPIIADDLVLVKARRVSRQALTSAYVVALDLQSGEPRWIRHVVSSGAIRRTARPFSTLIAPPGDGGPERGLGEVFVVSSVGAVASIKPQTGEVRWLSRFSVPLNPPAIEQTRRPWELGTPLVTSDRIIAIHGGERRIVVYDRSTGERLLNLDASQSATWNSPAYLVGDDHWVYAVGREVRAFRLDDLSAPAWTLSQHAFPDQEFELRGRVQVSESGLIVPTTRSILIVDRETGAVHTRLSTDEPANAGNPVALDAQLLIAGERTLRSYMSLRQAEQMLRDRVAASPGNPDPALSLAQLALKGSDFELCLEASELALIAIDDPGEAKAEHRQRLVSILLRLDALDIATDRHGVEKLFALLDRAAQTPGQRLAHRLSYGDRLLALVDPTEREDRSPADPALLLSAVSAWQEVLSTPDLASHTHERDGIVRSGWSWAAARLAKIIHRDGAEFYTAQAEAARSRFAELRRSGASASELHALAEEFPFTETAPRALTAASRMLLDEGDTQRALTMLIGMGLRLENFGFAQHAEELRAAYTAHCAELGLYSRADVFNGQLSNASRSRAPVTCAPSASGGKALVLPGRTLSLPDASGSAPTDVALVFDGVKLTAFQASLANSGNLQTRWSRRVTELTNDEAGETGQWTAEIVRWSHDDLALLLSPLQGSAGGPIVVMVDAESGETRWRVPLQQGDLDFAAGNETIAMADDHVFVAVASTGAILALDLRTGATIWQQQLQGPEPRSRNHRIHRAGLVGGLLAITGEAPIVTGRSAYALRVLDAATGSSILAEPIVLGEAANADGVGALWLDVQPTGRVIYATSESIGAIDLWRDAHEWINRTDDSHGSKRAWHDGTAFLFEDHAGDLRVLYPNSGVIGDALTIARATGAEEVPPTQVRPPAAFRPSPRPSDIIGVQRVADDVLAHYRHRIVRFGPDGEVRGADALQEERNYRWLLRGRAKSTDREDGADSKEVLVAINAMQPVQDVVLGFGGARRTQHQYRISVFSDNLRLISDPIELPTFPEPAQEAQLIDGWLLLSLSTRTVAVPMAEQ